MNHPTKLFYLRSALLLGMAVSVPALAETSEQRLATAHHLDQACEHARDVALRPLRQKYVEECVQKGVKDRPACQRFYADYGNTIQPAGIKFYDLPECVTAANYRHSYRRDN